MADLKTNYKDDMLDTSVNSLRRYRQIYNSDGTVSFEDVTEYSQVGDSFGGADINNTNKAINELNNAISEKTYTTLAVRSDRVTTKHGGYVKCGNRIHISIRFNSKVNGSVPVYTVPYELKPAFGMPLEAIHCSNILNSNIKAAIDIDNGQCYISVYGMIEGGEYCINGEYIIG